MGVAPAVAFVWAGLAPDDTATASANGEVLWLSLVTLGVGAGAAAIAWGIARQGEGGLRVGALTLMLVVAGVWGVVVGFLGSAAVSIARHPTWDDA